MPSVISSPVNIFSIKVGIIEALLVSVSSESFSLGYSGSGVVVLAICFSIVNQRVIEFLHGLIN